MLGLETSEVTDLDVLVLWGWHYALARVLGGGRKTLPEILAEPSSLRRICVSKGK